MVAGIPDSIALNDVRCLPVRVIDDDAGVVGVVDDVVADDVIKAAVLEFDAVSLTDSVAFQIVDIIILDNGVVDVSVG